MPIQLIETIERLRRARKAVILAHNYQRGEVQDVADFCGDSLGLSRRAAATEAEVIVFCGVHFMAQTAKLLSPRKTVIMPDADAGCPMADMITPADTRRLKEEHPGAPVVAYVNTTAEVKAESDVCCTSANAVKVVDGVAAQGAQEIIFIPDRNLAAWVGRHTKVRIVPARGFCPTHVHISAAAVREQREAHPGALFMCHPECEPEVVDLADVVLSTSGMLRFARETEAQEIIVGTEVGLLHPLEKDSPRKTFYSFREAVCPNMKKTTLASVARALETMAMEIEIDQAIAERARRSVERMVEVG